MTPMDEQQPQAQGAEPHGHQESEHQGAQGGGVEELRRRQVAHQMLLALGDQLEQIHQETIRKLEEIESIKPMTLLNEVQYRDLKEHWGYLFEAGMGAEAVRDIILQIDLDELAGFAVAKAHWIDIGSMDPGVTLRATEIYQEGLRLGPTQLADGGRLRRDLVDLLAANSRLPRSIRGDMQAMIAACRTGERRYKALLEKFGRTQMEAATTNIFDQCERLDRAAVASLPDGEYVADGYLDNDGHSDEPLPIKVRVTIAGSDMTIDVRGSSLQRAACVNAGLPYTVSAARLAFKFLINPDIPVTGGSFRPLPVIADPGSIFAAQEPAPTQRAAPCLGLLIDLVIRALAPVLPERVAANQCADPMNVYLSGIDPRSGRRFIAGEALGIGWGGHANGDGESALINYGGGDLKNFPVETMEQRYPLKIRRFGLQPDSGGPGRQRGGLGVIREYEIRSDDADVSLWFERSVTPGLGLFGGRSGGRPEVTIDPGSPHEQRLLKVNHLPVKQGTIIRAITGGGGGYAPPEERASDRIAKDLADGYITPDSAARNYT